MELITIFRVTAVKPAELQEACQTLEKDPHLQIADVGTRLFTAAVTAIVTRKAREHQCPALGQACKDLLNGPHDVLVPLLESIRMDSDGHPNPWQLLSNLASRALRGELAEDYLHTKPPDAVDIMKCYLDPDSRGQIWKDALRGQLERLGLPNLSGDEA